MKHFVTFVIFVGMLTSCAMDATKRPIQQKQMDSVDTESATFNTVETIETILEVETEPSVETVDTEPLVETVATEPEVGTEETEPFVETVATEPEVETEETEPLVETVATEPEVETEETEPLVETVETETIDTETVETETIDTETKPVSLGTRGCKEIGGACAWFEAENTCPEGSYAKDDICNRNVYCCFPNEPETIDTEPVVETEPVDTETEGLDTSSCTEYSTEKQCFGVAEYSVIQYYVKDIVDGKCIWTSRKEICDYGCTDAKCNESIAGEPCTKKVDIPQCFGHRLFRCNQNTAKWYEYTDCYNMALKRTCGEFPSGKVACKEHRDEWPEWATYTSYGCANMSDTGVYRCNNLALGTIEQCRAISINPESYRDKYIMDCYALGWDKAECPYAEAPSCKAGQYSVEDPENDYYYDYVDPK